MSRISWLAAAGAAVLATACVSHDNADVSAVRRTEAPSARSEPTPTPEPAPSAAPPAEAQAMTPPAPATPAPAPTGTYTDAQLRSFIAASTQIDPLNRQLATATAEQRTALATQIRGILASNNLDAASYNAIAGQARTDTALAARINGLRAPTTP